MKTAVLLLITAALHAEVTFHRDVLPVLQTKCQGCHRPGEVAPMSFLTYASTRPWAKAIRAAVTSKAMPPWFAGAGTEKFSNDPSLTPQELEILTRWADEGAPEGNRADAPPPVQFVDGWSIGVPDVVIPMPKAYSVPANGVVEYQHIVVPTGFTEDRWVKAVEIRPGNRSVVHHVIAFVRPPGSRWLREAKPGEPVTDRDRTIRALPVEEMPEFLLSYTPGRPPSGLAEGQARLIPAGSDIVFQLHYTPAGKAVDDVSKVGMIFAKVPPRERIATLPLANISFVIPPGAPAHRVDAAATVAGEARLLRLIPHMHLRGKSFEVRMVENGEERTLLRVPKYDFNWQNAYVLDRPVPLREGARLELAGWFDNSPNNRHNPDPKAEVRWGDQSWEEMMIGYLDISVKPGTEPKRVLKREAPDARTPFYGVWDLVSIVTRDKSGNERKTYGDAPRGQITYERTGRMSAILGRSDRKPVASPTLTDATPEQMKEIVTGFAAYYGTFEVDAATKRVIHHVQQALHPSWAGTDLIRSYAFEGNQMTLAAAIGDNLVTLVWRKK